MDDLSTNPAAGSDSDPVSLIEQQLEREQNPPTERPRDQKPEPEPETEVEETPAPEPGPETAPDDGADDDDGDDAEAEQPAEPVAETFTVRIDGKEVAVTREELLNGYQRQADYSRKTAEAAEQRRAAEALAQSVQAERQHYQQQLEQVATVLQAQLPPRPTQQDYDADPIGAVQAERRWQDSMQQLQHVLGERQRVEQMTAQQQQQMQQQTLAQAREKLTEMLPEWRDEKVAAKEKKAVADHLRAIGYAPQEISAAADPRALVMARESWLYRQMMANRPTVEQRIAQAPKMVKPGAAAAAPDRSKSIISKVKRSGGKDMDAIAALIDLG